MFLHWRRIRKSSLKIPLCELFHRSVTPGSEKEIKEIQIREDMKSELTVFTDSATTNAQRSRINILEEMSVQGRILPKPQTSAAARGKKSI